MVGCVILMFVACPLDSTVIERGSRRFVRGWRDPLQRRDV